MSIEGGTSLGGGVGSGVALGGPSFGVGSSIGSFGAEMSLPTSFGQTLDTVLPQVSEGPASLENTIPLSESPFNLWGELRFNPPRGAGVESNEPVEFGPLAEQEALATVEPSFSEAEIVTEAEYWLGIESQKPVESLLNEQVLPEKAEIEFNPMPIKSSKIALEGAKSTDLSKIVTGTTQAEKSSSNTLSKTTPKTEVQQIAQTVEEQEVEVTVGAQEALASQENQEEIVYRERFVLDEKALAQRVEEIGVAVKKAAQEAVKLGMRKIPGWLITKFLPGEHPGNRSRIVPKGPDGSIPETYEVITPQQFNSEQEAKEKSIATAKAKPPVKTSQEGEAVTYEDVYRVYKHHVVKAGVPDSLIKGRLIRKHKVLVKTGQGIGSEVVVEDKKEEAKEGRIEDFQKLSEVFPKAF